MKKRRKATIWILISLLLLILLCLGILYARPALRYKIQSRIELLFLHADITEIAYDDSSLQPLLVSELEKGGSSVTYNQSLELINSEYPVSAETFDLDTYKDTDVVMNDSIMSDYSDLSAAVTKNTGDDLFVMSSYRSQEEQALLYEEDPTLAVPAGTSEHQSGLALDVYVYMYAGAGFIKSDGGQYVNESCWKYGFVIRYGEGKKDITGVGYEPWHIRYVGFPHAEIMYKNDLCLEEYLDSLEIGQFYQYEDYVISRQSGPTLLIPEELQNVIISPDNMGNYVITGQREG